VLALPIVQEYVFHQDSKILYKDRIERWAQMAAIVGMAVMSSGAGIMTTLGVGDVRFLFVVFCLVFVVVCGLIIASAALLRWLRS
jgi:CHASE2 domain-containing sensor protein